MQSEDGETLSRLAFCDSDDGTVEEAPQELNPLLPLFADVARWLDIYFSGSAPPFSPPLSLRGRGTELQYAVWNGVMRIPFGERSTYGAVAKGVSAKRPKPCTGRGVGGALGRNPIAIIVPCHRVLTEDGKLGGYRWGVDRKQALLLHEAMAGR